MLMVIVIGLIWVVLRAWPSEVWLGIVVWLMVLVVIVVVMRMMMWILVRFSEFKRVFVYACVVEGLSE